MLAAMKTEVLTVAGSRGRFADYVELSKPRLNLLVVLTAAAGFYLAMGRDIRWLALLNTVLGTAMVAGGASAMNQIYERKTDLVMSRTRMRPLPDGRVTPVEAGVFALMMSVGGLLVLAVGTNALAAMVSLATLVTYVGIYTPLKPRTSFATVIGAVPGALPPMIGWAAATDTLSREAWLLFAIVFLWQMPHFLAIAWMLRDDYRRAGFPMLPVIEPDGRSTARQVAAYAAALVPVSLVPTAMQLTTPGYVYGALALSLSFLAVSLRFALARTDAHARSLFFASIIYLPLIWALMIVTRI